MPGKSALGQYLVASKFASLKGFLISSDEDEYSDEEIETSMQQKQRHPWLDDDDDDDDDDEKEDEQEKEDYDKVVKSSAVGKRISSGRKRPQQQHRRRPQQSSSSQPPPRHMRSSKSGLKGPNKKVPSREVTTSSDGEEEAVNINTEEEEEEEEREQPKRCQNRPVKQDSRVATSAQVRSGDDRQMITRPTLRKAEVDGIKTPQSHLGLAAWPAIMPVLTLTFWTSATHFLPSYYHINQLRGRLAVLKSIL
ncbi:unnamed protein product [Taenia asiatica]|uniref:Nuclear polyadenylated RNA-binding protein 3 n=1 Tax=Taenia asiatica TaxID=60517 RepID=A0A0R3W9Z4_TAEAS|nr:unnamed protein product [Taenia asiatica]